MAKQEQEFELLLILSLLESNLESIAVVLTQSLWINLEHVTIQMKAIEQYFHLVLFVS